MAYEMILFDIADGVATITLNRPRILNAMNTQLREEVCAALDAGEADDDVAVMVIKGAGRAFSSGADISGDHNESAWITSEDGMAMNKRYRREFTSMWMDHIWDNPKPVIAQVHGYCLGMAADLANACDFIIAADDAQIGFPEGRFGGVLMASLPWTIGMRKAKELLITAENIGAEDAWRLGMINRIVPADELDEAVNKFAQTIVKMPRETAYFAKLEVNRVYEIAGLRSAQSQSYDLNILAKLTQGATQEWGRVRREEGMKAALEWRDKPFRE